MKLFQWVLISLFIISVIDIILKIGKSREPVTPEVAVTVVCIDAILIYGICKWL